MDNCKLSHQDSEVNGKFINTLRDEYSSVFEDRSEKMKVSRGKVHEYLGMNLDYNVKGQFNIKILYYINEILECLDKEEPEDSGTRSSAAPLDLFVVDEDCEKISKEKSEIFNKIAAKMLFATKRSHPDAGTAISYLTTRVREPDISNWMNMVHLFKYVRDTKDLPLILSKDCCSLCHKTHRD